jgi:hypothetical protein
LIQIYYCIRVFWIFLESFFKLGFLCQEIQNGKHLIHSIKTTSGRIAANSGNFFLNQKKVFGALYKRNPDPAIWEVRDYLIEMVSSGELSVKDAREYQKNLSENDEPFSEAKIDRKEDKFSLVKKTLERFERDIVSIKNNTSNSNVIPIALIIGAIYVLVGPFVTGWEQPYVDGLFHKNANELTKIQNQFILSNISNSSLNVTIDAPYRKDGNGYLKNQRSIHQKKMYAANSTKQFHRHHL